MSADSRTLKTYGEKAGEYARLVTEDGVNPQLTEFISGLPKGAQVLDLGCGPGHDAAQMAGAGLQVEALDATPEMVALAKMHKGVAARVASFDEITGVDIHDGIWANFSLLHAPRDAMPRHLAALRLALRPGGLIYIALKTGQGSARDKLGRLYTYYSEAELSGLLKDAGFTPVSTARGEGRALSGEMAEWIGIFAHG